MVAQRGFTNFTCDAVVAVLVQPRRELLHPVNVLETVYMILSGLLVAQLAVRIAVRVNVVPDLLVIVNGSWHALSVGTDILMRIIRPRLVLLGIRMLRCGTDVAQTAAPLSLLCMSFEPRGVGIKTRIPRRGSLAT